MSEQEKKPSTVADIRSKGQRVITSPFTMTDYLIRDYAPADALRMDKLPKILDEDFQAERAEEDAPPLEGIEEQRLNLDFCEALMEQCCLQPRFTRDPEQVTDLMLHVSEVPEDIAWLGEQIIETYSGKVLGAITSSPEESSSSSTS